MILSFPDWRESWAHFGLPAKAIPTHPDLGLRWPWVEIATHALSLTHKRRVEAALRILDTARACGGRWELALSGGKDSTAAALLLRQAGWPIAAMSIRDDGDFPGETEYVTALSKYCNLDLKILRAKRSIWEMLGTGHGVLTGDLHSRKSKVAVESFYSLCDANKPNYDGLIWGIRAGESKGRCAHRRAHGVFYDRADGKSVAQPIADWSTLDVCAYIHSQNWPVQPLYLCVDPGQDWSRIRQDWFFAGGLAASVGGHYVWLRRWWPDLWEKIADIDPEMRRLS